MMMTLEELKQKMDAAGYVYDDTMATVLYVALLLGRPLLIEGDAGVGKTEEELKASGEYYNLVKIPMTYSGRFVAENETGNGLCKLLTNVNGQIIGCHLVGNPASEIIVIAGIAVEHGYTVDEFKKTVFPHPTVGEVIHESLYL